MERHCDLPGCVDQKALFQCSRCKLIKYCSQDHQRKHWKEHKVICRLSTDVGRDKVDQVSKSLASKEERECRCMFCGGAFIFSSEEEAVNHMNACLALQEQLNGQGQFTVPSTIQEKLDS